MLYRGKNINHFTWKNNPFFSELFREILFDFFCCATGYSIHIFFKLICNNIIITYNITILVWYVGIHKTNDSILMLTMNQYEEMDRYSRIRFPYETKVNIQIRVLLQRENEKAHGRKWRDWNGIWGLPALVWSACT